VRATCCGADIDHSKPGDCEAAHVARSRGQTQFSSTLCSLPVTLKSMLISAKPVHVMFVVLTTACSRLAGAPPSDSPLPSPSNTTRLSRAKCEALDERASEQESAFVKANSKCTHSGECANVSCRLCNHMTGYAFLATSATAAYVALASESQICREYVAGRCNEVIVKPVASAADPGPPLCKDGRCRGTNYAR
jgi:hypothetical protein